MKRVALLVAAILPGISGFSQSTLNDSLVAHYTFDGSPNDATGNGHHGTNHGATLVPDRFNNPNSAYQFDGINDYINTSSSFDYQYRTMSLWVKPHDLSGNGIDEKHIAGMDASSLSYGQLKAKFSDGNLEVRAGGESNNFLYSVNNQVWYHIALVRDGSQCRYYLNNTLIGTASAGTVASSSFPNVNFVIGAGRRLTNQFFEGVIDDIRIYNRALTVAEIDSLYHEADPNLAPGTQHTRVLHFDGVDDYVDLGIDAATGARTVEMWFKPENDIDSTLQSEALLIGTEVPSPNVSEWHLSITQAGTVNPPGTVRFVIITAAGQASQVYSDNNSWNAGQWYHVAVVMDANQGMSLYIDGVKQVKTDNFSGGLPFNNENVELGRQFGFFRYFHGSMDDVRISSSALYSSNFNPPCPDLRADPVSTIGLWNFNEGLGASAIDSSANNYHGQIHGAIRVFDSLTCDTCPLIETTDTIWACKSYTWIDGNTYTSNDSTAQFTLASANGCDSIVTLRLTIENVDLSLTVNDPIITANVANAQYQWVNCDSNYAIIAGDTNQHFTPIANGNYAVIITDNGCTDTSACVNIANVGLVENDLLTGVSIYPNPSRGRFYIHSEHYDLDHLKVYNSLGQVLMQEDVIDKAQFEFELAASQGLYMVEVRSGSRQKVFRVLVH